MTTYSEAIAAAIAKAPAISPATRDRIIAVLNPVGGAAR